MTGIPLHARLPRRGAGRPRRRSALAAGVALAALAAGAAHADAATLTVTRLDDPVPGACELADCSLREAVLAANASGEPQNRILLGPGTHALSQPGAREDAGRTGDLDLRASTEIAGAGPRTTAIDARGLDKVMHVSPTGTAASVRLSGLLITGGVSSDEDGGGIRVNVAGSLALDSVGVIGNRVTGIGRDGGGIATLGSLSAIDSTIAGNRATNDGGGITLQGASTGQVRLERTTVAGNVAGHERPSAMSEGNGGGIHAPGPVAPVAIVSSTITGNRAEGTGADGGGLFAHGPLSITSSTIVRNAAGVDGVGRGGGIHNPAPAAPGQELRNSIVALNTAIVPSGQAAGPNCRFPVASLGHNLEELDSCGLRGPGDLIGVADPRLGPLEANGGPTQTITPLPASAALDAGDPAACPPFDQRGVARALQGAGCDIGAVEVIPPPPAPVPTITPSRGTIGRSSVAPVIRGLSITPRRLLLAPRSRGVTLRYRLTVGARVRIVIERRVRGRYVWVATMRRAGAAGPNRVRLRGRIGRRALVAGAHRASVSAVGGGLRSAPARIAFAVVRPSANVALDRPQIAPGPGGA